jgi:hypothetical protein
MIALPTTNLTPNDKIVNNCTYNKMSLFVISFLHGCERAQVEKRLGKHNTEVNNKAGGEDDEPRGTGAGHAAQHRTLK